MKKNYTTVIFILLINIIINAHEQNTHQYIVREAYKLLLLDLGLSSIPQLNTYIGTTEGRNDTGPFKSPFVVSGAWNEDEQDPVYHYSFPTPTSTHFWEANIGDGINTATYLAYPIYLGGTIGPYENAYQKTQKYLNGGWTVYYQLSEYWYYEFTYNSLVDLYKNKELYVTYRSYLGENTHYDPPRHIQWFVNNDYLSQQVVDEIINTLTFNILGRIAHLLADMSVPTHTHRDQHADPQDTYEVSMDESNSVATVSFTLGSNVSRNYKKPGTRSKGVAMLREEFLKAKDYMDKLKDEKDDKKPSRDLKLETLAKVLSGEIPAMFTVQKSTEIMSALRLQQEFGFKLILDGAAEAYLLIDEIKTAGVSVILHPTMIRNYGDTKNVSLETAAVLSNEEISFALQSGYESYVPKTRIVLFEAAVANANGLSFEDALASITIDAAKILGIENRVGSIEEEKMQI